MLADKMRPVFLWVVWMSVFVLIMAGPMRRQPVKPELSEDDRYCAFIVEKSKENGVDYLLVHAVIRVESKWKANAINPDSTCFGKMQLTVSTARWIMDDPSITVQDLLTNDYLNTEAGIRYLALMIKQFEDLDLALTAYNRGPERVRQLIALGQNPFNDYRSLIYAHYKKPSPKIRKQTSQTKRGQATGHRDVRPVGVGSELR